MHVGGFKTTTDDGNIQAKTKTIFTVRRYALHGLSYRNSVRPSVTLVHYVRMQWRRGGICRPGQTSVLPPPPSPPPSGVFRNLKRYISGHIFRSFQILAHFFHSKYQYNFYRAKRSVARYCHDKLSVCPSVCPSVTLVDCDHMRWNSAKISLWVINLRIWFSADRKITDLLQRRHP